MAESEQNPTMTEHEQKGYDSWITLWTQNEYSPTASDCPARYMPDGPARVGFIRGWNRAKREYEGT